MDETEVSSTPGFKRESAAITAARPLLDWSAILLAHDRWLRRVVTTRVQERQAVDEVMQEVALSAVAQKSPLLEPARLVGWLYRLAVRQALMYRRRAGRHRALVERYAFKQAAENQDPSPSPLGWLLHDERRILVQRAMLRLPPRDADLLVLKYAEGWSVREIADRLGLKTVAVEARLHRARLRLRAELADQFAPRPEEANDDQS